VRVSDLVVRLLDVYRKPLDDMVDVTVTNQKTGRPVGNVNDKKGTRLIKVPNLTPTDVYAVQVRPSRHRAVGQFVRLGAGKRTEVEIVCPVEPSRVLSIDAPLFGNLPAKAQQILRASALDHPPRNTSGQALYESAELSLVQKAGLLNLFAKMANTPLPDQSKVLDHVDSLYRVRGDRVFGNVSLALRDLIKIGATGELFHEADDALHTPPPGFERKGSYKTPDPYGNLQVSFFSNPQTLELKADIDIDDAGGIQHAFQVIGHAITRSDTSPYDIHEILIYHQFLDPGYRLGLA
jgi:hypothetical protein